MSVRVGCEERPNNNNIIRSLGRRATAPLTEEAIDDGVRDSEAQFVTSRSYARGNELFW